MRVTLEKAGRSDIPHLVDLMHEFYAESSYALDRAWAAASFERLLGNESMGAAWLARRGEDAAGYVVLTLKHSMEFGGADAFVDDLFVRPDSRRQGVGTALLSALFEHCREAEAAAVHVELGADNAPALALYRRFGFAKRDREVLTAHLGKHVPVHQ